MTTHAELLALIARFEERFGVKVVPRRECILLSYEETGYVTRWKQGRFGCYHMIEDDAHAHIREGALNAVRWWCKQRKSSVEIKEVRFFNPEEATGTVTISRCFLSLSGFAFHTLGYGPATEDALSGAMTTILREDAR